MTVDEFELLVFLAEFFFLIFHFAAKCELGVDTKKTTNDTSTAILSTSIALTKSNVNFFRKYIENVGRFNQFR